MIINDIRLQQYRSYNDATFKLVDGVNIVVGPNGTGKTNLLEAVTLICGHKSFRAAVDSSLIKNTKTWSRIDAHESKNNTRCLKIIQTSPDSIKKEHILNSKIYKNIPFEYKIPIVIFEPNHLRIVGGEPSLRRDYLDGIISQKVPSYNKTITDYKRTLAQRNRLLKNSIDVNKNQLFVWNLKLVQLAEKIVFERLKLLENINPLIEQSYNQIAPNKPLKLSLKYKTKIDTANYSSDMLKKLENNLQLDLLRGFTGFGPHREDLEILSQNSPLEETASRGEVRTFILSLKLAELEIINRLNPQKPLLLLDDVFSELDASRRHALLEVANSHQTIISTTDADSILKDQKTNTNIIKLENLKD